MRDLGLTEHLPRLRRYARVLTGDRSGGDLLVAAACDVVVEDPLALDPGLAPRVAIHRVLTSVYNAIADDPGPAVPPSLAGPTLSLARQATLLVTLAEFSPVDAARILDVTPPGIAELMRADAGARTGRTADVLVVCTDSFVALELIWALEARDHRIVGMATSRAAAVALARAHRPDIVIATGTSHSLTDGDLPLDVIEEIRQVCAATPLVVTATPERLLRGNAREPAFVIAKPFRTEVLAAVVGQMMDLRRCAGVTAAPAEARIGSLRSK
jgi:hypothetical protein